MSSVLMEAVEDQPGLNQPESRYEMEGECEFRLVAAPAECHEHIPRLIDLWKLADGLWRCVVQPLVWRGCSKL